MPLKNKPLGKLISFEGAEGSGKSTQIARLAKRLATAKVDVLSVREPGGTEIGEQVRNIIVHNSGGDEMCAETELLLFAAARAQLVREVIAPALLEGTIVLSDRFMDSSTVYQGIARNLASDPVSLINTFAIGNVMPTQTIVLDVPPKVSKKRIRQRASDVPDRMERENIDFYEKVRKGYLLLAQSMPERIVVIDGTLPENQIEREIWKVVKRVLAEREADAKALANGKKAKPAAKKKAASAKKKTAVKKPATKKKALKKKTATKKKKSGK